MLRRRESGSKVRRENIVLIIAPHIHHRQEPNSGTQSNKRRMKE
jgi:hypothetical protein